MKTGYIKFCLLIMIFCGFSKTAALAIRVVELKDSIEDIYLFNDHLEIAEDLTGQWTIDSITRQGFTKFKINTEDYRYVENHASTYWIHIKVQNNSSFSNKWIFEVLSMHTHDLQLYYKVNGKYEKRETG